MAATPPPIPAVWETLDTDTQTLAVGDTDRTTTARPPRLPRPGAGADGKRIWLYAGLGVLLLTIFLIAYFAFFNKQSKQTPPERSGPGSEVRRIVVSKADGENTVPTLREAISRATPGDTIVIVEPKLTEPGLRLDRSKHKDLTIESGTADGRPAVIETAGTFPVLLDVAGVEGFRMRGVEFHGHGTVDVGIQISGNAPGTTIEGVTVRGAKTAGFKLSNAAGEADRPILLDRCRVELTAQPPTQVGVLLWAANTDTRRVMIRNSRFQGMGTGTGLRIEGSLSDTEITGNRFYNLGAALSFLRPRGANAVMKGQIISNTVYQAKYGMQFELPKREKGEPPAGKFDLLVDRNYFTRTDELARATGEPMGGLTSLNNGFGPETKQTNPKLNGTLVPSPLLPTPDPNSDATFLRFTDGPPEVGPNKVKVGAP
jgi:hypothetical protein